MTTSGESDDRTGGMDPSRDLRALLLAEAALAEPGPPLQAAWTAWRRSCPDLDGLHPAEYRLLPHVWRRVQETERRDPDAERLRGTLKKAWVQNHHVLREAARHQAELAAQGIRSFLGRESGLLAGAFDELAGLPTTRVDLAVGAEDLRRAGRVVRSSLVAVQLHARARPASDREEAVRHGSRSLLVEETASLLYAHLSDLFARSPSSRLSPASWVVDLALALRARPGIAEPLLQRIEASRKVALFRPHFTAAERSLPRLVPLVVRRVLAKEPAPFERALYLRDRATGIVRNAIARPRRGLHARKQP